MDQHRAASAASADAITRSSAGVTSGLIAGVISCPNRGSLNGGSAVLVSRFHQVHLLAEPRLPEMHVRGQLLQRRSPKTDVLPAITAENCFCGVHWLPYVMENCGGETPTYLHARQTGACFLRARVVDRRGRYGSVWAWRNACPRRGLLVLRDW